MNDFTQQISECYQILSTSDSDRVEEASDFLINFYSQPNAFTFIVDYILNTNNPLLQKGAIVGMKMILQNNTDILQTQEACESLLNLTMVNSEIIRKFAIFYVSQYEIPIELIIQFVQSYFNSATEDSINDIELETCMRLTMIALEKLEEEEAIQLLEQCSALSIKAFQLSNINLITTGAIFRLSFIQFIQDEQDPIYQEYMESSFQVLNHLLDLKADSDKIDELIDAISFFIRNNPFSIDYHLLLELVINFISTPELSQSVSEQLLFLSDNIIECCQNSIKEQEDSIEIIIQLLSSYCFYSKKTYNPNNSYELSDHLTFSTFFKVFFEDQYINEIYAILPSLFEEDSSGRFTTLLILASSFEFSSDFYITKIPEIYNLFQNALEDQDFCVRTTTSIVITEFCQFLNPTTIEFDTIITSLIDSFTECPSIEFLTSLTAIFNISTQTDSFFDHSFAFLMQILEDDSLDSIFKMNALNCLSSLTKSSRERVCAFYDQIFTVMSQILLSDPADEINSGFIGPAVLTLSNLCESCTSSIEQFVPTLLDFVMEGINHEEFQFECINGLSAIFEFFTEQAKTVVDQVLNALFEIAMSEEDQDDDENTIDNFDEDDLFDDDIFTFQGQFNSKGAASRTICKVLSLYPDVLLAHFDDAISLLVSFREGGYGTVACSIGASYIARALVDIDDSSQQSLRLINEVLIPFAVGSTSDAETCGKAFYGLSVIVSKSETFVSEEIINALSMTLKGELFFQRERVTYNETLFDGIRRLFKSLMKLNFFNVIEQFLSIIQEFLELKSGGLSDFALNFFSDFISAPNGLQNLNEELVTSLVQYALEVEDGYAQIHFLTKLTEVAPDSVIEILHRIFELITSLVFDTTNEDDLAIKGEAIVVEKCVLLLNCLLQKVEADISSFIPLIIQSTPPSVLLSKSSYFYQLILWIQEQQDGSLNQQIAAAVIRLFCEPDYLIIKRKLSDEGLMQIKGLIQSLAESIPDFNEFCAEVCDNDEFKMSNLNSHAFEE